MNWRRVKLILLREVRDQARDRRTLFMILVLPLLLYPLLGLGLVQLTLQFGRQQRLVGIVGAEALPSSPPLLSASGDRFDGALFDDPGAARYYPVSTSNGAEPWTRQDLSTGRISVLVILPPDLSERLGRGESARLQVLRNGVDEDSIIAYRAVVERLGSWGSAIVARRMEELGRSAEFARPIEILREQSDISPARDRAGTLWGKVFPFLLVIMTLTGAFYPAVDLCAGEKERGTMETLLITPAARGEVVLGKFLAILSFSVITAACNLVSMGLTFGQIIRLIPPDAARIAEQFATPSAGAIGWMLLLMLPLAAFFSALSMALAIFARSSKEGQYYLMPLFLVVAPLTFATLAPGVKLGPFTSLIPVTNTALLLRALLLNQYGKAMIFLLPVLASTMLFGYLALRFALDQFNREDVLFREAERFDLVLWLRRLLREKDPTPSAGAAWSLYVLMLLLLWYSQGALGTEATLTELVVTQLAFIGFPALLMGLLLTGKPARTLLLQVPKLGPALLAVLAVICVHPLAATLGVKLQELFPLPDELRPSLERLVSSAGTFEILLAFAIVPAICEEIAYRGFILSGLLRKHPPHRAILISSILFGVSHMATPQMVMSTLLGIVLGIIATRTGSIFPGMAFHAIHNGWVFLVAKGESASEEAFRYGFSWLIISALSSALVLGYLASLPSRIERVRE